MWIMPLTKEKVLQYSIKALKIAGIVSGIAVIGAIAKNDIGKIALATAVAAAGGYLGINLEVNRQKFNIILNKNINKKQAEDFSEALQQLFREDNPTAEVIIG